MVLVDNFKVEKFVACAAKIAITTYFIGTDYICMQPSTQELLI